jgi:large subunit ribosomal protein L7A
VLEELNYAARIVGVKQLRRALADGRVRKVFLADDADPALTDPIREACTLAGIPVETAASARQLGQACGISVAGSSDLVICGIFPDIPG